MVKAIICITAALALSGCAKCFPDRSNTPCNVGFYHAHDWDDVGYKHVTRAEHYILDKGE